MAYASIRHVIFAIFLAISLLLSFLGIYFVVTSMFLDPKKDTTSLSNSAFLILGLLANLAFSYARTMDAGQPGRKKAIKAGEDFFLAAVIFAVASLLKYTFVKANEGAIQVAESEKGMIGLVGFFS